MWKNLIQKIKTRMLIPDRAAGTTSVIFIMIGLAIIIGIALAVFFDYQAVAQIGLGIISAFAGIFTAIANVITNFIYSVGGAVTGQATGAVNNAGGTITTAWNSFVHWITHITL